MVPNSIATGQAIETLNCAIDLLGDTDDGTIRTDCAALLGEVRLLLKAVGLSQEAQELREPQAPQPPQPPQPSQPQDAKAPVAPQDWVCHLNVVRSQEAKASAEDAASQLQDPKAPEEARMPSAEGVQRYNWRIPCFFVVTSVCRAYAATYEEACHLALTQSTLPPRPEWIYRPFSFYTDPNRNKAQRQLADGTWADCSPKARVI